MVVVIVDLSKERVYRCLLHDVTEIPAAFNAHGSGFNRVTLLLFLLLQTPQSIVLFTLSWKLQSEKQHVQNINHQKESTWIVRFPSLYFIHSPSSQFNQYITIALVALTHQSPANIQDIMHLLSKRMKETSWIVSVAHWVIRKDTC